jgi:hypothetical protein
MPNAAQQWGRQALDFVDAVERLNAPEVIQMFEAEIKADIMARLPPPGDLASRFPAALRIHSNARQEAASPSRQRRYR